jgi:hypothetical protein
MTAHANGIAAGSSEAEGAPPEGVTLSVNSDRVCYDPRDTPYLNFDLILSNSSSTELKIDELRAVVTNSGGEITERRLIWQQAVRQLSPDAAVGPQGRALIFNPFLFRTVRPGSKIRYEIRFAGQALSALPISVDVTPRDCANPYRIILPIKGRVLVYDGHDLYSHHRRTRYGLDKTALVRDNFQRFGLDLVVIDREGKLFTGDGLGLDQWHGWGQEVRAAAAGVVAAVHDGQPDNRVVGKLDEWTDRDSSKNPMTSYGNYVLIEHGPNEFTVVGHLRQGSVRVRQGQRVAAGQPIAQIGNSGASGGVHVHFERRTGFGIADIKALPPYVSAAKVLGTAGSRRAIPIDTGDVITSK